MSNTVLARLMVALDAAATSDGNVFEPPIAVLWPDQARQWEGSIGRLGDHRRILTLADYRPEDRQGPAYWVRCTVARTIDVAGPSGIPIVYLPGVSRDALRAASPDNSLLAPLVALQHRSQWFAQPNGKDWTIRALFSNKEHGLGLNVAADEATATALVGGISHLLEEQMSRLDGRHIDASFLNSLLNPDPVRLLLKWIDDPNATQQTLGPTGWAAFEQQCKSDYGFNPSAAGVIEGALQLGLAEGPWLQVWQRYRESPSEYPGIPSRLREAQPAQLVLSNPGAWPDPASEAEDALRAALLDVEHLPAGEARQRVLKLEEEHKARRSYVWADLGWTPLVLALEHLAETAHGVGSSAPTGSVKAISDWYAEAGWKVDRSVLKALDEAERLADRDAVAGVLNAIYKPWLDHGAKALQDAVGPEANSGAYASSVAPAPGTGDVVVFIDGLRLDVGHLLVERLEGGGVEVATSVGLAALPTVTQTAKPVLAPIDQSLLGPGGALEACRKEGGASAGMQILRSLMSDAGVQVLGPQEIGDPGGRACTETGEIDHKGHDLGPRLAHEIADEVQRIARRIGDLLEAGWSTVTVVTDHGWLLVPSGLPKNEALPVAATVAKKGRCARVKEGASVDVPTVPWHWDKDVRIALAPGISCFEANQAYEHGGVSPQECFVPRLVVTTSPTTPPSRAEITSIKWRGLTLVIEFSDLPDGAKVDLRRNAGDAGSSIADLARVTGGSGRVILLVEDEDLEGERAQLVVVASDGTILLQRETTVAQNR